MENPNRDGPTSASLTHSYSVPSKARLASVFRTTRRVTELLRASWRNAVIPSTDTPRASATTRERALVAVSLTSATIAFLSSSPIATGITPGLLCQTGTMLCACHVSGERVHHLRRRADTLPLGLTAECRAAC